MEIPAVNITLNIILTLFNSVLKEFSGILPNQQLLSLSTVGVISLSMWLFPTLGSEWFLSVSQWLNLILLLAQLLNVPPQLPLPSC